MTSPIDLQLGSNLVMHGHVLERLRELADGSVHCVVTSPPYWGLRDYGIPPVVWDGDPGCEHEWSDHVRVGGGKQDCAGKRWQHTNGGVSGHGSTASGTCIKCGAWRGCYGLEPTPELYVQHTVQIFREVRRVLRDDGTLWLNIGDSYSTHNGGAGPGSKLSKTQTEQRPRLESGYGLQCKGLKPKDLIGIPWRVAFALQADGWYLRSDIVWHKPNPMPESVNDRPTKAHEYVFLLSKSPRYYYDAEAIKSPVSAKTLTVKTTPVKGEGTESTGEKVNAWMQKNGGRYHPVTANRRSVWTVSTKPYPEAHFATYPPALVEPCIKAGTSAWGCCPSCGAGWVRVVDKRRVATRPGNDTKVGRVSDDDGSPYEQHAGMIVGNRDPKRHCTESTTVGWLPGCQCYDSEYPRTTRTRKRYQQDRSGRWKLRASRSAPASKACKTPATVLDPFTGSGTTGAVAIELGRRFMGCEISEQYMQLIGRRLSKAIEKVGLFSMKMQSDWS